MWNLKNNINKQNKNRLIDTVNRLMVPEGRGLGRLGAKGEGIERYRQLQNSHGDVKYSIGNIINNVVITMYDAQWVLEISGGTLYKVYNCEITMLHP